MQTTKNTICLVLFAVFFGLNLSAQYNFVFDKNGARWSVGAKGGIDYFFVKPHAEQSTKFKTAVLQASWTAPVLFGEYTYNEIYSFGLESGYFAYNRGGSNGSYAGGTIDAALYASFNFSNIANKNKFGSSNRVSWYGNVGLGCSYYRYKVSYRKTEDGVRIKTEDNGLAPLSFVSVTCAVNITNNWEVFAEGQYRAYFTKNMGGESVKAFTSAIAGFIGVRLKIL